MPSKRRRALCLLLLLASAAPAVPTGVAPTEWPLERICANLEARLRETPDNATLHYCLGRAHGFAFELGRSSLLVHDQARGVWCEDLEEQADALPSVSAPPSGVERATHLTEGVRHLLRACETINSLDDPNSRRFELTTAWLIESGAHLASRVDTVGLFHLESVSLDERDIITIRGALERWSGARDEDCPRELLRPPLLEKAARYCAENRISSHADEQARIDAFLRRFWLEQAIEHYRHAFESVAQRMNDTPKLFVFGLEIAEEASAAYARLVRSRGWRDPEERQRVEGLAARVAQLESLPHSVGVTPLLLSIQECASLEELVTRDVAVPFDLDGNGIDETWPWLAPDAGWLVWDPNDRGEITSGQQLFGSASAWLFFSDGYRVLDALDDDRDGQLRGRELAGIRVWFDRDSDGVSDRGEVVSVEDLGIVALSTRSTLTLGASPANLCGAELADGRVLPTYDWVLEPVRE